MTHNTLVPIRPGKNSAFAQFRGLAENAETLPIKAVRENELRLRELARQLATNLDLEQTQHLLGGMVWPSEKIIPDRETYTKVLLADLAQYPAAVVQYAMQRAIHAANGRILELRVHDFLEEAMGQVNAALNNLQSARKDYEEREERVQMLRAHEAHKEAEARAVAQQIAQQEAERQEAEQRAQRLSEKCRARMQGLFGDSGGKAHEAIERFNLLPHAEALALLERDSTWFHHTIQFLAAVSDAGFSEASRLDREFVKHGFQSIRLGGHVVLAERTQIADKQTRRAELRLTLRQRQIEKEV